MFGARQRRATGIHIADEGLYLVELIRHKGELELRHLVREPLPAGLTPARLTSDEARKELAQFLKQTGAAHELRFKNPCLALGRQAFLLKRRPRIQGDDRVNREHLWWEARQVLPDRFSEYALDCVRTPHYYFLVAVRRRMLGCYAALCREAGLSGPLFDVGPFALYNALEASGALGGEGAELLLDIGAAEAIILLINFGQLQAVSSCRWEEGAGAAARIEALAEAIRQLLDAESGTRRPQHLWLSGAAAADDFWGAALKDRLAAEARMLDPFQGVAAGLAAEELPLPARAAFGVAAGLAYRRLSEND